MSGLMAKIFGAAPVATAAPVVVQPAPTPGNIPANAATTTASTAGPGTAPNGTVPATTDTTGAQNKSGLDQFADLFQTDPNAAVQGQPLFNISHEKMMESARKQDFSAAATPEQMAAIEAGGKEAFAAMAQVMNTVAQNVYAQATFTTTKLIEKGLDVGGYAKHSDVDGRIRSSSVSNSLRDNNPLFNHAAAAPLLRMVSDQMLVKYPNATPAEISTMAQDYLANFASAAQAPAVAAAESKAKQGAKTDDWSNFLEP